MTLGGTAVPRAAAGPPSERPRILSAYYGYNNCIGIADANGNGSNVDEAQAAGCNVRFVPGTATAATNAPQPQQIAATCMGNIVQAAAIAALDGMPVTFSGAVVPFGLNNNAFTVTLSDGTEVTPTCVTLDPANELNESQTVLLVGQFGEPRSTGGIYPAALTINTPLFVSASGKRVGEISPGTSIDVTDYDSGPLLLAATIAPFTGLGETAIGGAQYPNHCGVAFPATTHVVQLVWSGGITRDGVNPFVPGEAGLIRTATADGLLNLKVRTQAGALIDYFEATGVNILGVADLGNGVPANTTAAYTADGDNYLDLCLQLPRGFSPSWIEQVTTDPANSFGLQAFDPAGDTPNPAQTISIVNESKARQAGF